MTYGLVLVSACLIVPALIIVSCNTSHICNTSRCEANSGSQTITNSWYHDSINVTVPAWHLSTTWTANSVLLRFDNVIMALWVLLNVSELKEVSE